MESNLASREELVGAVCADCGERLTDEQIEVGAELFRCECGSREIRLRNGDLLAELPDA